ncbi:DNA polymerase III subunit epsilon [Prosthecomicrobium pneumaticum]|uniref:DNA polymerase III subunit epsilon n=1 Tax=Prosthecomicrobium pneumaticum TaxID=81895 RepID=A0A7W9L322_9HYPH|nr:DNA polymerase III subunit epsilon [Prosthecomicrobium pneumaticum]MBB5754103.1 DNA polymerase-3 subunit epsilon [Prosthecomicrobium pneumaticum]
MREIIFDTETTGLDPLKGDRLVEIGCVELFNHIPTGRKLHLYINPQRSMPAEAFRVHGLSDAFLADKPIFSAIAGEFVDFIGDARLVAHNAMFDLGFINAELGRLSLPVYRVDRIVDTLMLARQRHPLGPNSLDALCNRYGIDISRRTLHGALLDAELLAEVYIELIGGRQAHLGLSLVEETAFSGRSVVAEAAAIRPQERAFRVTAEERAAHRGFVEGLGANAIWTRYFETETAEAAE